MGQITVLSFCDRRVSVAKMKLPCRDDKSLEVGKEASEKTQKATWASGIGTNIKHTGWTLPS